MITIKKQSGEVNASTPDEATKFVKDKLEEGYKSIRLWVWNNKKEGIDITFEKEV